ncbi:hypothetical protein BJX63DRAFT_395285 [Aspergillus granulosus]|uniref:Cyclohexanone monooxygenase n=1 Tax=Aspergillus granulosus TaxID=176169 RepID=A0ABR4HBY8_9EURO
MSMPFYDALVIGAGFGGIYQLYSLLKLGLSVKVVEQAEGLGGTWRANRYPGAMSDTPSPLYRYSWDKEDLLSYPWSHNYLDAKEILTYLEHVADRHNLRKHMQFNTQVRSAKWNEAGYTWTIETNQGTLTARYLITAIGQLVEPNWPNIPGRETFQGELYHSSRWPDRYDFSFKSVGIIGNGATGVQLIARIASEVGSLLSFQRHPLYVVPANRRPITEDERVRINERYDETWHQARESIAAMGVAESTTSAMSVSPEERERVFQDAWDEGGPFRFALAFSDIMLCKASNEAACDFIKAKIGQIVRDPEKRRKLTPTELYARRPLCGIDYYEQFNRENVDIVDVAANPIAEFTSGGIKLADGTEHKLDVIICATGFDAMTGAYNKIDFVGHGGITLKEHWENGPSTNLSTGTASMPNLFMIAGPTAPLVNIPAAVEAHVEFITKAISHVEERRKEQEKVAIISKQEGDTEWQQLCDLISDATLYKTAPSFYYGANIEGKQRMTYVFFGGIGMFIQKLKECEESGYSSFDFLE